MTDPIVIVGAGHAGVQVASRLVDLGWSGRTVLIDAEGTLPYERPPLSKDLLAESANDSVPPLRREKYFDDNGIETVRDVSAISIDPEQRLVLLSDGSSLRFYRLVIATGAVPRRLVVPGADLEGVQYLKTLDDARALRPRLMPDARVVVIGAGYIGMEVAAAAAKLGCQTTVLEFQNRVMSRVTSPVVSEYFQTLHEDRGVRFVFGAQATSFEGRGHVANVHAANGSVYPADVVVVGVGVIPNQQIAKDAGIDCLDGIVVDDDGRTSHPLIYAAGDVTRFQCPWEGVSRRLECVQNALSQADAVARHIMGSPAKGPEVPWFWTIQHGVRLQTAGVRNDADRVVVRGNPSTGKFSVLYFRDHDKLAAIDTVNSLADFGAAKKLIAAGAHINSEAAADSSIKLSEFAPSMS